MEPNEQVLAYLNQNLNKKIADGNPGVGSDSWLFIDEILID